jgi:hypothetical protein
MAEYWFASATGPSFKKNTPNVRRPRDVKRAIPSSDLRQTMTAPTAHHKIAEAV